MELVKAKLVTIIADEAIENAVLGELRTLKVQVFTRIEATGEGLNRRHELWQ